MSKKKFIFWAVASLGRGLSGSDRIYIELARRWSKWGKVDIYVWEEGAQMLERQQLGIINSQTQSAKLRLFSIFSVKKEYKYLSVVVIRTGMWCRFGFLVCYIARVVASIAKAMRLEIVNSQETIIYNASEFWMDSLPCVILKLRYPRLTWVASWYQTAPNPLIGYKEEGIRNKSYFFSALLYWLAQLPVKPLIKRYADKVIVNNQDEKKRFPEHTKRGDTIVLIGAVPLEDIKRYLNKQRTIKNQQEYDAVFQGRFHPQKGVVELIDIWKKVVVEKPGSKLAMIGDGPLMKDVRLKIKKLKLENNIKLFGYLFDGPKKYSIFHASKIVVHPAFYDSGGMASAEAMAFGIPAVGFNLKAYKSYYPKGMVKVKTGDMYAFSNGVIKLLQDSRRRNELGKEALKMVSENWSWEERSKKLYRLIFKYE